MNSLVIITASLQLLFQSPGINTNRQTVQDPERAPDRIVTYKQIDTLDLNLEVYFPKGDPSAKSNAAIVFFFGGGWKTRNAHQFAPHATYYADRGYVTILADYRVKSTDNSTPFESVMDAKSAMRFIKQNAEELRIDPTKIIASGGSAGGHLAAATALITSHNDPNDDLTISAIPNALVLFNPAIDNGPGGCGYEQMKTDYLSISPLHNITVNAPPTIIFIGTKDDLIPVETITLYQAKMDSVGSRCEVKIYEGRKHGFFNYRNLKNYEQTIVEMDAFLKTIE